MLINVNARFEKFSVGRKVLLGWVMKINVKEEEHWDHHRESL